MNNNSTLFSQRQFDKPGPVAQERYEDEKVIECCTGLQTGVAQYKLCWLAYSLEDDQWVDAKDISTGILQDFCTKGSLENTSKTCLTNNGRPGRCQGDETLTMIQNEQDPVMNLLADEEEITTNTNNIIQQIFDLFL